MISLGDVIRDGRGICSLSLSHPKRLSLAKKSSLKRRRINHDYNSAE